MDVHDLISKAREREGVYRAALDVDGPTILGQLADALEDLVWKNRELSDRLWSADRTAHAHDPWEGAEDA